MPIRLSGMNSGLDTESIIAELVKAKSQKKEKLVKAQTKLEWKQEAWKELNSKVYALYSKTLSNMRLESDYMKKTTKVSNANAATVITGMEAVNGVQTLRIKELATSGYLTGGEIKGDKKLDGKSLLVDDLGVKKGSKIEIKSGDTTKVIEVNESTTIDSFINDLKSAGVNANFDEKNQRFFISSKKTGKDNDFTLTGVNDDGLEALQLMKLATVMSPQAAESTAYGKYCVYNETTKKYEISQEKLADITAKEVEAKVARAGKINELLTENDAKQTELINKYTVDGNFTLATTEELEEKLKEFTDRETALSEKNALLEEKKAALDNATDDEKTALEAEIATLESEVTNLEAELADLGDKASVEEQLKDSKELNSLTDEKLSLQTELADVTSYYTENLDGTYSATDKMNDEVAEAAEYAVRALNNASDGATRIEGKNAVIVLNDAEFESDTNTFAINGLTITANMKTEEAFTITTSDDTDGIYDMIKNFLKEYNTLINEMDSLYNADSAKGYEPLTDEEKEAMSEKEVEKWEEKIKDSLLRRDSTLSTVSSAMKTIMMQGVTMGDGSKMYLSDFGISTLGYFSAADNEKNAYHIDGDPDDKNTSGNADKLKTAIANDPEKVIEFFTTLSKDLYTKLGDLMKKTEFSSSFTLYDDVSMKDEYNDYKDKISKQEQLIADYEDRYYKKFTAMETALAKMQSQQNAVSGLFGM